MTKAFQNEEKMKESQADRKIRSESLDAGYRFSL
jgi:hypothetical protein